MRDLQRETARLLVNFRALADLSAEIASAHDFTTTARSSLLMVLGALSATRGALLGVAADGLGLTLEVARGVVAADERTVALGEESRAALSAREAAIAYDGPPEALRRLVCQLAEWLPGMVAAAPLVVREQLLGLILIGPKLTRQPYTEGEFELFSTMAMMLASGMYSHQLIRGLQDANQALRDTQEQLIRSEKLATIGQLAAGIAHEVRNPLTSILGFAGTIQGAADRLSIDDIREYAGIVVDESRRLESIIDEVRQYAKPKGYELEAVALASVVDETVSFLRFDRLLRKVEICREIADNPSVRLNRDKIKQVLLNLLRNAAEAMPDPAQGVIRLLVRQEPGYGVVQVRDNGIGMPAEVLEHIFDAFFTTKGDEGTGLGLDICRQIIEQGHGGQIWAESEPGVGTTFTLRLPLASGPEDAPGGTSEGQR